jgi:hypothetical protein
VVGFCEHGNERCGSIKGRECFDRLRDYQFLKKDSVFWAILLLCTKLFLASVLFVVISFEG